MILSELGKEGQNLRKNFQRRLPSDPSKDYYFIHRNTGNTEPVIVEYGFLDSSKDDVSQLKNNYKNLADGVVRAVLEYIGYSFEPNNLYVVKKGDSLWSISKRYNISVDELKRLNGLTSNLLNVGQVLIVSNNMPIMDNELYIVKQGDTLYGIASRYGISVDELKSYNNLTNNTLSIGQQLFIPNVKVEDNVGLYETYRVVAGDTLYGIASRYGVSIDDLRSINNLNSDILSIGQIIRIPSQQSTYIVKKGDTLYSISKLYNLSPNDIMSFNNLTSNLLSIGQVLKIPSLN